MPDDFAQACEVLNRPLTVAPSEVALPECAEERTGALILGDRIAALRLPEASGGKESRFGTSATAIR
jgi:hypothetical protein